MSTLDHKRTFSKGSRHVRFTLKIYPQKRTLPLGAVRLLRGRRRPRSLGDRSFRRIGA
jgi:hypothetical protein